MCRELADVADEESRYGSLFLCGMRVEGYCDHTRALSLRLERTMVSVTKYGQVIYDLLKTARHHTILKNDKSLFSVLIYQASQRMVKGHRRDNVPLQK